jgi:hypothetical protein
MMIEEHSNSPAPPMLETSEPAAGLHIEVLDRRGRLRMRTRVDELPCVIGRAYSCGVVLDDRFVSAEHIRLRKRADGAIVIEDLGSANGTYNARTGARVDVVEVTRGAAVRIGQTLLRFHTADEPVEPALPLPGVFSPPRWAVPVAFAVVFAVFGVSIYLETYSRLAPGPFVFGSVALAVVLLSWAGAWGLISRVLQHQSHIGEHCVVACSFVTVYILAGWALDYYTFAFAADRSAEVLEWIVPTVLIALLLYGHGRFISTLTGRQVALRSAGFAGACAMLLGMIVVAESFDPDWTAMASFRGGLKPPLFRMVANDDLDAFFTRVEELKVRVDDAAETGESPLGHVPSNER